MNFLFVVLAGLAFRFTQATDLLINNSIFEYPLRQILGGHLDKVPKPPGRLSEAFDARVRAQIAKPCLTQD